MTKYFIIGLNKTGTSSIRDALELSLRLPPSNPIIYRNHKEKNIRFNARKIEYIFSLTDSLIKNDNLTIFKDRPWNTGCYKELNERYDNSKFILTIRDEEEWWISVQKWLSLKAIWGKNLDEKSKAQKLGWKIKEYNAHFKSNSVNKKNYLKIYNYYNNSVIKYFKDKPNFRLLKINKNFDWINIQKIINLDEKTMRDNILKSIEERDLQDLNNLNLNAKIKNWKFLNSNRNNLN